MAVRRIFDSWYDVIPPGHGDKQILQNNWEETGREFDVSWSVLKEKWRSVLLTLSYPLVNVLNIHANVKEAWKCVGSDDNIV